MTGPLIVTRPLADALPLAARLTAQGYRVILAPMLTVRYRRPPPLDLAAASASVFTSANAVRALAHIALDQQARIVLDLDCVQRRPAYTVGAHTAAAAREAGFAHVISADGAGKELAALLAAHHRAGRLGRRASGLGDKPILHFRGSALAFDLRRALSADGILVQEAVLYDTIAAADMPHGARQALALAAEGGSGAAAAVLLYSPKAAARFGALVRTAGLEAGTAEIPALCLSSAVARAAATIRWRAQFIAAVPDGDALLRLLAHVTMGNAALKNHP